MSTTETVPQIIPVQWELSEYVKCTHQKAWVHPTWVYAVSRGSGENPLLIELSEDQHDLLCRFVSGETILQMAENLAKKRMIDELGYIDNDLLPEVRDLLKPQLEKFFNRMAALKVIKKMGSPSELAPSERKQNVAKKAARSPFYIDIPIVNPDRFLNAIEPYFGWILSFPFVMLGLLFVVQSLLSFFGSYAQLGLYSGLFQHFTQSTNWILLLICLVVLKIPHEIAHALSLRRAGFKTFEMGFILLVFTPCLYCRVDEIILSRSKLKQLWVALSGVYVDLLMSALAAHIFMLSPSSDIGQFARLFVYANLGYTMFVNLIPLMRFDGHYALAYLWGRPNLGTDARDYVRHKVSWLLEDTECNHIEDTKRDWFFLGLFGVASYLYRVWIIFAITSLTFGFGYNLVSDFYSNTSARIIVGSVFGIATLRALLNGGVPLVSEMPAKSKVATAS